MTDTPSSSTDPADDDLLASLYLDGEATAEERARVEANPDLLARVRAFEAMANDLSSVAPPPDLARMQISAALDLFDQQQAPAHTAAASTRAVTADDVTSLSERRARRRARGLPTWLSAAAALALVVGGIGFVATLGDSDDDASTSDAAMESADETSASGANRSLEAADSTMAAPEAEATEQAPEAEAAMEESMESELMADDDADSGADSAADATVDEEGESSPGPATLDGLDADTASEYFELLSDQPLQPVEASPCAGSPLVDGLFGVDSFIPVIFDGEISSLLVQAGVPSTAVIVGPTCEIELE